MDYSPFGNDDLMANLSGYQVPYNQPQYSLGMDAFGGGMGGIGMMDPEVKKMIQARMLMSMGARMLQGGARGEKTGSGIGGGAMAGINTTDQLMQFGLRSQLANRANAINEGKYKMLQEGEQRRKDAAESYKKAAESGGKTMTMDQMLEYQGILEGNAGYIAAYRARNNPLYGLGGDGVNLGDPMVEPVPEETSTGPSTLDNVVGYLGSEYNPLKPVGDYVGQAAAGVNPQSTIDALKGTAAQVPNTLANAWGATKNALAPVTEVVAQGVDSLVGNVQAASKAADKAQFPYLDKMPEFDLKESDIGYGGSRAVYDMIARGGIPAYEEALMSGKLTPKQQEYAIKIIERMKR